MGLRGLSVIAILSYLVMVICLIYCAIYVNDIGARMLSFSALTTILMIITMILAVCIMNAKNKKAAMDKYEEIQKESFPKSK